MDLLLRCIVGINDDERTQEQDVVVNITLYGDLSAAVRSDCIRDTVNYKAIKKRVIAMVERSEYFLVEALAGRIADICLGDARVERVRVKLEKPGALRFARSVGVEIIRDRRRADADTAAYVAVGSNIDPKDNIQRAMAALAERSRLTGVSTFYHTPALDRPDLPSYINGVVRVATPLSARELKDDILRVVEDELGRERVDDRHAPRTIDLDLILHGDRVYHEEGLHLPDPDIRERSFVAAPLLELDADLQLPDTAERLDALDVAQDLSEMEADDALTDKLRRLIDTSEAAAE